MREECTAAQLAALDELDGLLNNPHIILTSRLRSGSMLILDNYRFFHGRTAIYDSNRWLKRIRFHDRSIQFLTESSFARADSMIGDDDGTHSLPPPAPPVVGGVSIIKTTLMSSPIPHLTTEKRVMLASFSDGAATGIAEGEKDERGSSNSHQFSRSVADLPSDVDADAGGGDIDVLSRRRVVSLDEAGFSSNGRASSSSGSGEVGTLETRWVQALSVGWISGLVCIDLMW